jgi:hypothetical protein
VVLQTGRATGQGPRTGRLELAGLALVLLAGLATAWWAGGRIQASVDISGLTAVARVLGIFDITQPLRGHDAESATLRTTTTTTTTNATSLNTGADCQPGQQPTFERGVATLKQQLGDTMGAPVECEHPVSATGDTVQQTSTGLAMYRAVTNTVMFTDGWRHWALTPDGMVRWEGEAADPPSG